MDGNQIKMDIEETIKKEEENIDEEELNKPKLHEFYQDKEIGLFFESLIENSINRIIDQLNNYYEIGDWTNCILLMKKITTNRIFKIFKKEKKIELLDIITKKLITNIYFYSKADIHIIIEFLSYNIIYVPKNYIFDWKQFFTMLYIMNLYDNSNDSFKYINLYSKLNKFFPKDAVTVEEYQILSKSFLDSLVIDKISFPAHFLVYFLPQKYL